MKLKRPLYGPKHPKGPTRGPDVKILKRTLDRHPALDFPKPAAGYDDVWNQKASTATARLQRLQGISPASGDVGQLTLVELAPYMTKRDREAYAKFEPPQRHEIPDLGPVVQGGQSVLDHDLTHATGGIPLFPAFDDAFVAGRAIIAPEAIEVTQQSSSRPGDAFYAKGQSGIRYWFGHLVSAPATGGKFTKGETIGVVLDHDIGGGPHVHVGVNVEGLLGKGRELKHKTSYQHGAPTVGDQLREALA